MSKQNEVNENISTEQEMEERLSKYRGGRVVVHAELAQPMVGGQPATDKGLQAFVEHHLKLTPETPEFVDALARIRREEIGERETTPETGEVKEEAVYAVNVIRRNEGGAYIAEHQLKALLKQAASRLGLFVKKRGCKGDVAELGSIRPVGGSKRSNDFAIHLVDSEGNPAQTSFRNLCGSVQTPMGKKSISTHAETAPEGSRFSFEIIWPSGKLTRDDMLDIVAAMRTIGIGSALSLEFGRFRILAWE